MESKGRTQEQRSAATRQALVAAGRRLWAERGYAEVGTPEIAAAAGVTRGAMYHQFADKADLFLAVAEAVEQDVMTRLVAGVDGSGADSPAAALRAAVEPWLSICVDPEVRQLLLLDAPSVLGWKKYRDIAQRYSLGVTEHLLVEAMDAGQLARQPARALAHILIGALDEAAMVIATAEDRDQARADVGEVLAACSTGFADRRSGGPSRRTPSCELHRRQAVAQPRPVGGREVEVELEQRDEHEAPLRGLGVGQASRRSDS